MDDVLGLTTPLMKDRDDDHRIAQAQHLLAVNRFQNFRPRDDDSPLGTFGEDTAAACHRAKYWLGWAKGTTTPTFGRNLERILETGHLPRANWTRRQLRLRRAQGSKKLKALNIAQAEAQKHVVESPAGSNRVIYSTWYGLIGPWCAMFVTWCGVGAGQRFALRHARFASVNAINAAAAGNDYGLSFIGRDGVEPGDIVTYDWEHNGDADHTGLFEKWVNKAAGTFTAIEGNTAEGNDSNGGEVQRRTRSTSLVSHFIRVEG